jgi:biopolymer transport protein ExbD
MAEFSPAQRAYIKKKSKYHELDVAEASDELNIVPFLDIVVNLIMFLLMSLASVAFFFQVESTLPTLGGRGRGAVTTGAELNLNVTVTNDGVIVSASGGKLAPGCQTTVTGRVMTVPIRRPGEYDWAALTSCIAIIKQRFPDESRATISADPQIEFQHVMDAMDAVRSKDSQELFPEVLLSAGVR